jgi:hypothetical protein
MSALRTRRSGTLGQMSSMSSVKSSGSSARGAVAGKRSGIAVKTDSLTMDRRDQKLLRMRAILGQEFPRESDQVSFAGGEEALRSIPCLGFDTLA